MNVQVNNNKRGVSDAAHDATARRAAWERIFDAATFLDCLDAPTPTDVALRDVLLAIAKLARRNF